MPRLILSLLIILTVSTTSYAGWVGPETVVSGGWGKGDLEFGFNKGDFEDSFPKIFSVFPDGKIVIDDIWNGKLKIYNSDGKFIKAITPPGEGIFAYDVNVFLCSKYFEVGKANGVGLYDFIKERWIWTVENQSVGIKGNFSLYLASVYIDVNHRIYIWDKDNHGWEYSPEGKLVKLFNSQPGVFAKRLNWHRTQTGGFKSKVKIQNEVFTWTGDNTFDSYQLSKSGEIYAYGRVVEKRGDVPFIRLVKISKCGEVEAFIDLPSGADYVFDQPPTITPEGNVYYWKREASTYSILKWTWVDSQSNCQK